MMYLVFIGAPVRGLLAPSRHQPVDFLMLITGLVIASHLVAQLRVMDRERLNYSALSVAADYEVARGQLPFVDAAKMEERNGDEISYIDAKIIKRGSWSIKDQVERYEFVISAVPKPIRKRSEFPAKESQVKDKNAVLLYDGRTYLFSDNNGGTIFAAKDVDPMHINSAIGPFQCWDFPYATVINEFIDVQPIITTNTYGGRELPCVIYRKGSEQPSIDDFYQLEITFDPTAGYLPIMMRRVTFHKAKNDAIVQTRYMHKSHLTENGTYLPKLLVEQRFTVKNFVSLYPNYTFETIFKEDRRVATKILLLKNIRTINQSPSIKKGNPSVLSAPGANLSLKSSPSDITLQTAISRAGSGLETFSKVLPTFERAKQPARQSMSKLQYILLLSIVLLVGILSTYFRSKKRKQIGLSLLLVSLVCSSSGCGFRTKPEVPVLKISAEFTNRLIRYDLKGKYVTNPIILKNNGTLGINISQVDGGCSCRRISQSQFPFILEPGKTLSIPAEIQLSSTTYSEQPHRITVFSAQGNFILLMPLLALIENRIVPEAIANGSLRESSDWEFNVTHRKLLGDSKSPIDSELIVDADFLLQFVSETGGYIPGPTDTEYLDRTYKITLKNRDLGSFRSDIQLLVAGRSPLRIPIVWTRTKDVSFVPAQAIIYDKAARVFLRSANPDVEIGSIISAPDWVIAQVEGPKELTIRKREGSRPIDSTGIVRVSTTDPKNYVIDIPIISVNSSPTKANP